MKRSFFPKVIIMAVVALAVLAACVGKSTQNVIPDKSMYSRADSMVIQAGQVGDFERVIALADSLVDAGELSPIRADNYRGIAYISMGQMQKSIDCFRRASGNDNPPAEDFWEYINAGSNLAHLQNAQNDLEGAIGTALHFIERLSGVDSPRRTKNFHWSFYF